MHTLLHEDVTTPVAPSLRRRAALVAAGVLSCALPTVFALNLSRMLLVGELSGHRFHQLTGQGLLLVLLWFAGLVPLLRAGWSGRRPSTASGLLHLTFVGVGLAGSVAAPGGGAPILTGLIAATGAVVWAALPVRPRLRTGLRIDPVLAPLALLMAALQTPYVVGQVALQNGATGHHAQNPHFFDMAWLVMVVVVLAVLGACVPVARRLSLWSAAVATGAGAAGLALGESMPWSLPTLVLGVLTAVAALPLASWLERRSAAASAL